ncbi:MAG: hypothetical protein OEM05_12600 [Myxococcales bacterium]|nr:hypothetical protein [Myxococcales bacterium]
MEVALGKRDLDASVGQAPIHGQREVGMAPRSLAEEIKKHDSECIAGRRAGRARW